MACTGGVVDQHALEVAQIFRQPQFNKSGCAFFGFALLFVIVEEDKPVDAIETLLNIEAIKQLKARHFYTLDTKRNSD